MRSASFIGTGNTARRVALMSGTHNGSQDVERLRRHLHTTDRVVR